MKLSQMRAALDARKISVAELTKEYLKKITEKDAVLNSYITVCGEAALLEAEAAQKIIDGGNASPLTGIPMSVKDNICTSGIRTTCASKMLENFVPFYDASVVSALKNEHAVILGKTNMDEFAMGGSSRTSYFNSVKNPYDTSRVPGGSSGGAAAAVSAGLCAAALGSDTGGSIRQPASFCGVTGLKPTYGAVSRYGLISFAPSLDQIGVIGKCAEDTGYVLNRICGADKNDAVSSSAGTDDCLSLIGKNISDTKIGIPSEFFSGVDEEVRRAVLSAADYYKSMGCEIIECSLPSLEYAVSAYYLISSAEASSNLSRFDGVKYGLRAEGKSYEELVSESRRSGFGDEVKRRIMLGSYALCSGYYEAYYNKARKIRAKTADEYRAIFEKCNAVLTPTAPTAAYKSDYSISDPVKMYSADICTVTANIAGLPSISTTCGYTKSNMPIGMSLTGRAFDEKTIIALCDCFERDFSYREAAI